MGLDYTVFDDLVDAVYATEKYALGTLRTDDVTGKTYRFCKVIDTGSFTAIATINNAATPSATSGYPVALVTTTAWNVSCDASGGSATALQDVVGVVIGKATATFPYAWVQTSGYTYVWAGAANIAGNTYLIADTNEDGEAMDATEASVSVPFAISFAAIAGGACGVVKLLTAI
jgi:hypothetical protein